MLHPKSLSPNDHSAEVSHHLPTPEYPIEDRLGPIPSLLFDTPAKVEAFFANVIGSSEHIDILIQKSVARGCEMGQSVVFEGHPTRKKSLVRAVVYWLSLHSFPNSFRKRGT